MNLFNIALALFFALIMGPSWPAFADKPKAAQAMRTLVFPRQYTIGTIYNDFMSGKERLIPPAVVAKAPACYLTEARGTVKVPVNSRLLLVASSALVEHPEILRTIEPNLFTAISFNRLGLLLSLEKVFEPLTHLTGLQRLDFELAEESDENVKKLAVLPNLKTLDVNFCGLNGTFIKDFVPHDHLLELCLSDCKLDAQAYKSIGELHNLQSLNLVHTESNDNCLPYLTRLANLQELLLDGTKISPRGLVQLQKMKKLETLGLTNARYQASDLVCLSPLHLKRLYLPHQYSAKELAMLHKAMPGTDFHLEFKPVLDADTNKLFAPTKF